MLWRPLRAVAGVAQLKVESQPGWRLLRAVPGVSLPSTPRSGVTFRDLGLGSRRASI